MNTSTNDRPTEDEVYVVEDTAEVVCAVPTQTETISVAELEAANELAEVIRSNPQLLDKILGV